MCMKGLVGLAGTFEKDDAALASGQDPVTALRCKDRQPFWSVVLLSTWWLQVRARSVCGDLAWLDVTHVRSILTGLAANLRGLIFYIAITSQ